MSSSDSSDSSFFSSFFSSAAKESFDINFCNNHYNIFQIYAYNVIMQSYTFQSTTYVYRKVTTYNYVNTNKYANYNKSDQKWSTLNDYMTFTHQVQSHRFKLCIFVTFNSVKN